MADATTAVPQATTPTPRRSKGLSEKRLAFFMVAPSMALIALVAAYPIAYGIWLSLHEYSVRVAGLSRWAGLRNYSNALSDSEWWAAFFHTFIFAICSVSLVAHRAGHGDGDARGVQGTGRAADCGWS